MTPQTITVHIDRVAWKSITDLLDNDQIKKVVDDAIAGAYKKAMGNSEKENEMDKEQTLKNIRGHLNIAETCMTVGDYAQAAIDVSEALKYLNTLWKPGEAATPPTPAKDTVTRQGVTFPAVPGAVGYKIYAGAPAAPLFAVGDKVFHPVYGKGKIIKTWPDGYTSEMGYFISFKKAHIDLTANYCESLGIHNTRWFKQSDLVATGKAVVYERSKE